MTGVGASVITAIGGEIGTKLKFIAIFNKRYLRL